MKPSDLCFLCRHGEDVAKDPQIGWVHLDLVAYPHIGKAALYECRAAHLHEGSIG